MASLAGVTSRVAAAPGRFAAGTAKNIYSAVKGAVVSQTGIGMLKPTNIAAAIMEKSGLSPFLPSVAGAFAGGGRTSGTTVSNDRTDIPSTGTAPQQVPVNDNQTQTSILTKILNVDTAILEIAQRDTKNLQSLSGYMGELLNFLRGDSLKRQEEARESRVARGVAVNDNTKQAPAKTTAGAGIMGLLSLIPGFNLVKGVMSGITDAFNTIVKYGGILLRGLLSIGRFLVRFAGPIGAVIGVLLSLESQDWEKYFGRFTDAFNDFLEGKWIDGILKVLVAPFELIGKGILRLTARIIEFFGFEKAAAYLDKLATEFDLLALLEKIYTAVKDAFVYVKDTVVNFFSNAKDKIAEWWSSFSIIDPIVDIFTYLKDSIVNLFTSVKDKVAEWFEGAANLGSDIGEGLGNMAGKVWEFFKSLPGKMVDAASNLVPDFIKEPFRKLFGTSAPTPTAAPQAPAAPAPAPAVRSTTPAIPSGDIEVQKYAGKSKGEILEDIMSYTGGDANQAMAEAERIYSKVSKATATTTPPVQPTASMREVVFNAQSSRQAVEQSTTTTPPVIINNNTTPAASGMDNGRPNARMGGAVSTSPRDSHIDRALYGNVYGAGVP